MHYRHNLRNLYNKTSTFSISGIKLLSATLHWC